MLKHIPPCISPELMNVLMRMGHGDDLVLADGNFPAETNARHLIRSDGHSMKTILDAVLKFLPVDTFVETPVRVMRPVDPRSRSRRSGRTFAPSFRNTKAATSIYTLWSGSISTNKPGRRLRLSPRVKLRFMRT